MSENVSYRALGPCECIRLLAGVRLGRLALHAGALPTVALVDAVLTEDGIVVNSLPERWFASATDGAVVAFEADGVDPDGNGRWSVVVVGEAAGVAHIDPDERARLDAALGSRSSVGADHLVRISLAKVSGCRRVASSPVRPALTPAA